MVAASLYLFGIAAVASTSLARPTGNPFYAADTTQAMRRSSAVQCHEAGSGSLSAVRLGAGGYGSPTFNKTVSLNSDNLLAASASGQQFILYECTADGYPANEGPYALLKPANDNSSPSCLTATLASGRSTIEVQDCATQTGDALRRQLFRARKTGSVTELDLVGDPNDYRAERSSVLVDDKTGIVTVEQNDGPEPITLVLS